MSGLSLILMGAVQLSSVGLRPVTCSLVVQVAGI